ncbi:MAG: pyridoxal phosphate-dependent aminotransferase [Acidobacteria bacterium]|nr:pyridoxal phosphate-dependent aminotransferase [Acidobacteriota bacterium]
MQNVLRESRRLAAVQLPVIPIVGRWIAETPGTISLGQGIVSYDPPPEVGEAVRRFGTTTADHRYGPVEGLPVFVEAIQAKLAAENGITLRSGSRVFVTAGGNQAFMNAVLAVTDPGDEVILLAPYYFNHEMAVVMAGACAVRVPTDRSYQLDVQAIAGALTPRTRAVVTVSPNNPTGAVYPEEALRAVNALCESRGVFHIHDEAYEYFTYGGARHFSPGGISGADRHTISLYSLSKAYALASWRIGYMVVPEGLWQAVNKIQDTLLICPPAVSQQAGRAALSVGRGYVRERLSRLDAMRRAIHQALTGGGVPCELAAVEGAFYYLVRVHSRLDAMTLAERLIREHRVAAIPGSAFGDSSSCSIRISYGALDPGTLDEGLSRLVTGLRMLT